jgi:hypothetical protein
MRRVLLLVVGVILAPTGEARACTTVPFRELDPVITATVASSNVPPVRISSVEIERGCGTSGTGPGNCSDVGHISLGLSLDGPRGTLRGVRVQVVSGDAPMIPDGITVEIDDRDSFYFAWGDALGQPPLDFTVVVQGIGDTVTASAGPAVNEAGPPASPIQITDPGDSGCNPLTGCTCIDARATGSMSALLLLLSCAIVAARRKGG